MTGLDAAAVKAAFRRQRFAVREAEADGVRYLYGDRHRWTKLATLISHMGLILFLIAGVVTWRFGDEQGLVVGEGDTLTVQPIGTPGLAARQELPVRGARLPRDRPGDRLHDRPRRLPERPGDRAQDDPGERSARRRRLHVPRERVRGGARAAHQRRRRQAAVGRPGAPDRHSRSPAVRNAGGAGPRHRPEPAPPASGRRDRRPAGRAVPGERRRDGRVADDRIPRQRRGRLDGRRGPPAERPRLLDRRPTVLGLRPADRQEGSRAGDRVDGVRAPDHRPRDHVLPAAAPGLGAARADRRRPARRPVRSLRRPRARVRAPARRSRRAPDSAPAG